MKSREKIWALAVALAFCVTTVYAQSQNQKPQSADPSAPIPPSSSPLGQGYGGRPAPAARGVSPAYEPQPYDPSQVTPDENTLAGAQLFGVGSLERARNVFDPSLSFSQLGQTYPDSSGQSTLATLGSTTILGGGLNFDRTWSRYHLTTLYTGGEGLYRGYYQTNRPFHNLSVAQEITWNRWRLLLRDDFTATPGASFTGSGMGGPGSIAQLSTTIGSSLNSIGNGFVPVDTIDTGNTMRYLNSVLGQAEYWVSRRSTFTFAGSYGLLHFANTGYFNSRMMNAQAGYDYQLDPANSIAILGSYGNSDFPGTQYSTTNYTAALAYGRKITGRLAFQLSGGPQRIHATIGTGNFQLWYAAVNSALTYQWRRSGYSLSFQRGLSSGSGVFLGAKANTFTGSTHYQFTRFWTGALSSGYAINISLAPAGTPTVRFDNWFIGANLGRQIGRHAQVNFNYGLQKQYAPAVCPVAYCGVNGFQQTFGMTLNWHLRPNG